MLIIDEFLIVNIYSLDIITQKRTYLSYLVFSILRLAVHLISLFFLFHIRFHMSFCLYMTQLLLQIHALASSLVRKRRPEIFLHRLYSFFEIRVQKVPEFLLYNFWATAYLSLSEMLFEIFSFSVDWEKRIV